MRKTESEPKTSLIAPPTRADFITAGAAGLVALVVYAATMAPTVTGEDSGELIGAAWSLGIPHPPGYPVWTMLAHAFTWLPFGTPGWRVNALSAVCGAGTVGLLTLLGSGLTGRRGAALLGAMCLAFSRVFWEHALIAEVYTLTTLFMVGLLYRCLLGFPEQRPWVIYGTALFAGVGAGVHSTLVLLLPFWLVLLVHQSPPGLRRQWTHYAKLLGAILVGTGVYLYLPLASLRDPAMDWGNPETLRNWWDVIRREQYAFMVDQYPRSLARFAGQCWTMVQFWFRDFIGLGAMLSLAGFGLLFRRQRYLAMFLILMALSVTGMAIYMQNFEQDREWHWVMRVFLIPAEAISALGLMAGLAWLGGDSRNRQGFVMGIGVALLVASLVLHSGVSKRHYTYAEEYGRNILASLPEGAIYVPVADHQTFPVLYLQITEDVRPDVTVLRKYGHLDLEAVPGLAESGTEKWGAFPKRRYDGEIITWALENTDRPLYLHPQEATRHLDAYEIVSAGLLMQVLRPGESPQVVPLDSLSWQRPLPQAPVRDYSLSLIQVDWASAHARMDFAVGHTEAALQRVEEAVAFGHREPIILHNMGSLCARNGAYDAAAGYFEEALKAWPENEGLRRKLARARELAG